MSAAGRWVAVVGGSREGRDAALDTLVARWRARGVPLSGFRPRDGDRRDEQGKPLELYLEDLASGARVPLGTVDPTAPDVCSYRFDAEAFATAARWCEETRGGLVVLAGLGPLEAAGRGHAPLVHAVLTGDGDAVAVLSIRRDALAAIALELPDPLAALELPADEAALERFGREVEGALGLA